MIRFWNKAIHTEKGMALPIVLVLLALGGLLVVPGLQYATTGLKYNQQIIREVNGTYAAEAGVEYTIWDIQKNPANHIYPVHLPENINGLHVDLQTENQGIYTLYMGSFVELSGHSEWFDVSSTLENAGENRYKYTITAVPYSGVSSATHLVQVGARLPDNYTYETSSASLFGTNISTSEPTTNSTPMVNWVISNPGIAFKQGNTLYTLTQVFYINGSEPLEGQYSWIWANPDSINVVGEVEGGLYNITSTATDPSSGKVAAIINAKMLITDIGPNIFSWQITK